MRTFRLAALAALTALAVVGCSKDDDAERPRRITILFTTDEHSHLFAFGNEGADWPLPSVAGDGSLVGGVARRATILDAERAAAAQRGGDSVVVSSGDFSQGTLAAVAFVPSNPDLGLMRLLGYEVVALGNHEFDLGPAALAAALGGSVSRAEAPPLVLTNVAFDGADPADDSLAALYGERGSGKPITRSHVVVTQRGLRIGFVSSMGYDAARAAFVAAPVRFADAAATTRDAFIASAAEMIQAEVDSLRASGVDAIVMLGHGGIAENPAVPGDDERLAKLLTGVDLILAGHTHLEGQRSYVGPDGFQVPILAAPALGRAVGRVELMLHEGGRPTMIEDQTAFLPVDSATAPTASAFVRGALAWVIAGIEAAFLPDTLTAIEGAPVTDDPSVVGDLYFRKLCSTPFTVTGLRQPGETNALNLDTDALLAVALGIGLPSDVALQYSGGSRADFFPGDITMADVFRMAPLGGDPTTGTPGYPLIRAATTTAELRAAIEGTLPMAYPLSPIYSPDFYLAPAGLRVVYDPSRTPLDPANPIGPGWVTEMALVAGDGRETLLYDATADLGGGLPPGWTSDPTALRSIVTTYIVGAFAESFGITLRDPETGEPLASLDDAVVVWPGTPHTIKDHQVIGRYLKGACAANGGELPSIYDETRTEGAVPRRVVCEGAACP
jgi:5'-nucleotidase